MPVGASSLREAVRWGAEVFQTLKGLLKKAGHNTNVGDEGGFAPNLPSAEAALDFCVKAIESAGFKPGADMALGLDCARRSSSRTAPMSTAAKARRARSRSRSNTSPSSSATIRSSRSRTACPRTTGRAGSSPPTSSARRCQLVGDDLFVTNVERLGRRHQDGHGQLDPGQGQPDRLADRDAGRRRYGASRRLHGGDVAPLGRDRGHDHRRSRRRDQCGQIKTGSLARSDRLAKYNQLIRIEEELGEQAKYAGRAR